MAKLSLNLIIPLTSVFQPQFLFRLAMLALKRAMAVEHRPTHVLQSSDQMRQLMLPCLIRIKKEFSSLTHWSEVSYTCIRKPNLIKIITLIATRASEFNGGLPSQLVCQWRWSKDRENKKQVILLYHDGSVIIQSARSISWFNWWITGLSQLCDGHTLISRCENHAPGLHIMFEKRTREIVGKEQKKLLWL